MTDTDLKELQYDILREMYKEAEPGLDFDDLRENPDEYPDEWYDRHYLPQERQDEIYDEHMEGVDMDNIEHAHFAISTITGMSPRSTPKDE